MNRISIVKALVALVLAGSLVGVVEAATILVDDDGAQCPGALTTIQAAVTSAAAGDTIRVCAGEYFEEVTVDNTKTDLTLVGVGLVQLKAPLLGISPAGFAVDADGVQIERFEISGFGQCGILVTGDRASIQHNDVHHDHFGICLQANVESRVRNNLVRLNAFQGISTTDGTRNEISGNQVTGGDTGIFVGADSDSAIHHNLVLGSGLDGIEVSFSAGTGIRNNTVRLVAGFGIVTFVGADVEVVSNNIQQTILGLAVDECNGCTVSRNSVNLNNPILAPFGAGIVLSLVDGSTISQNAAHRNGVVDCFWDGTGSNVFVRNACGVEDPPGAWD